jgi:prepilin-type N-terminal cleavage/methylation domain-containing protein
MMRSDRRGLSLVELLIAVVLLGIVGAGITRMLQSQMRYFSRTTNAQEARSVSRNALNLLRSELRMVEPLGIVAASADSLTVRLPYATGLNCSLSTGTFAAIDSLTQATAVFAGYAWKDTISSSTYNYVASATAPAAGLPASCTTVGLAVIPGGRELILSAAIPTVVVGAPLLLYQTVTYKIAASSIVPGRTALWRRVTGGANEEIAVPFDPTTRFRFYTIGGTTAADAVPSPVTTMSGVELVLVGESERPSPGTNAPEEQATRVAVFFRNSVQ